MSIIILSTFCLFHIFFYTKTLFPWIEEFYLISAIEILQFTSYKIAYEKFRNLNWNKEYAAEKLVFILIEWLHMRLNFIDIGFSHHVLQSFEKKILYNLVKKLKQLLYKPVYLTI